MSVEFVKQNHQLRMSRFFKLDGVTAHVEVVDEIDLYQINLILTAESKQVYDELTALAYDINDSVTPAETDIHKYQIKMCLHADANE